MAATYSKIQRNFWETDTARDMTPEEKYFWLYLQTNANVNTLGCYVFRMRRAQDETGYNRETLEKLLTKLEQGGRIYYDGQTGEVFLRHWSEISWGKKTATLRAIAGDWKEVQSGRLRQLVGALLAESGILTEGGETKTQAAAQMGGALCIAEEGNKKEQRGTNGDILTEGGETKTQAAAEMGGALCIAEEGNKKEQRGTSGSMQGTIGNKRGEEGEEEEEEKEKEKKEKRGKPAFTPPTLDEVLEYCRERGGCVDAERFLDFYAAKGWMIGKNRMKDWRAAVRNWERTGQSDARCRASAGAEQRGAPAEDLMAQRLRMARRE